MKKYLLISFLALCGLFAVIEASAQNQSISGTQSSGTGALPGWFPSVHVTGQATSSGKACIDIDSTGNLLATAQDCGTGSGGAAFSSLTAATTGNTLDNTNYSQIWNWSTITTGDALSLATSANESGKMLAVKIDNTSNTGYAGFFSNTSTAGQAVYAKGNVTVTGTCTGCAPINALYYTATSRTLASSDVNNIVSYNNSVAGSWVIPTAGSTGFAAPNSAIYISNIGSGALTLSTTGGSLLNGLSGTTTYQIPGTTGAASWVYCIPDASNNYDCVNSILGTSSGTGSTGQVAYFSNTNTITGNSHLFASTTGSFGIGTSSPAYLADIHGTVNVIENVQSTSTVGSTVQLTDTSVGGAAWALTSQGSATSAIGCFDIGDDTNNINPITVCDGALTVLQGSIIGWNTSTTYGSTSYDTDISRGGGSGLVSIGKGTAGDTTGAVLASSYRIKGTKFSASGCSNSATAGGGTGGKFTLGATSCTVTITPGDSGTATNGWIVNAMDVTTTQVKLDQTLGSTTTVGILVPSTAQTSDVIVFSLLGY